MSARRCTQACNPVQHSLQQQMDVELPCQDQQQGRQKSAADRLHDLHGGCSKRGAVTHRWGCRISWWTPPTVKWFPATIYSPPGCHLAVHGNRARRFGNAPLRKGTAPSLPQSAETPQTYSIKEFQTPTSASWLNAVETWFSQLERRSLYRNSFTSVQELRNEIRRYIGVHNQHLAKPFKWRANATSILAKVERAQRSIDQC